MDYNYLLAVILVTFLLLTRVQSRELRPTEHGLPFQNLPASSPEMMMFFGEQESKNPSSSAILQESSSNETASWWGETPVKRKESNVRKVLLVATVVCGGTGVVLLLAAAFLFGFQFLKGRSSSELSAGADNNANNQSECAVTVSTVATVPNNK